MIRPPPRSPLFPYTPLFRSVGDNEVVTAVAPGLYPHLPKASYVLNRRRGEMLASTLDRKSTRLNSSHANISYAVFCLKKKKKKKKKRQVRVSDAVDNKRE